MSKVWFEQEGDILLTGDDVDLCNLPLHEDLDICVVYELRKLAKYIEGFDAVYRPGESDPYVCGILFPSSGWGISELHMGPLGFTADMFSSSGFFETTCGWMITVIGRELGEMTHKVRELEAKLNE